MKRLWLTIAALLLAAGPASAQFNTRGTQSYRNALTANNEFGLPRFTTTLLPACSANNLGAKAWDLTASKEKICDASSWVEVGGGIAVGDDNDWTGAQTFLDNKWTMKDGAAVTATMVFLLDDITAGQQSIINVPDADFTLAGLSIANVFTAANTFGSAVAAADSFVTGANSIIFEGATDDEFEITLTVTDPDVDSTFTVGYSPDGNPWIGATAGDSATSAELDDVLLGSGAGTALTGTATDHVFVGDNAGAAVTTADEGVCIGADSCGSNTTGRTVTAVGFGAGPTGTNFGFVTLLGGLSTAAGAQGTAGGYSADVFAPNGTAFGYDAETADGVAVGHSAGNASAAADIDNVFVGNSAGGAANGTSTDNTCVGDLACNALTTGDGVLMLGANTDVGTATDSFSIAIGEGAIGDGSNTMKVGSATGYVTSEALEMTANGAEWVRGSSSEQITLNTGGVTTTSSGNLLPADALIESVVCRVTTNITTAANWQAGDAGTIGRFIATTTSVTAGDTDIGLVHMQADTVAAGDGPVQPAAAGLVITTNANPGAGVIRCTVFHTTFVAPTS